MKTPLSRCTLAILFVSFVSTFASATYAQVGGYYIYGSTPSEQFGSSISNIANIIGNSGESGFVVGSRNFLPDPNSGNRGKFSIYDKLGNLVASKLASPTSGSATVNLGHEVRLLDDINGDGVTDYLVSAPNYLSTGPSSKVFLYSGSTVGGQVGPLVSSWSQNPIIVRGISIAVLGNLHPPLKNNFVVGSPASPGNTTGYVSLYSGSSGTVICSVSGNQYLGQSVGNIGDINGDGYDDFAASNENITMIYSGNPSSNCLKLFQFGNIVYQVGYFQAASFLKFRDFNNDGYQDFLLGLPSAKPQDSSPPGIGVVRSISGKPSDNGLVLFELWGDRSCGQFGTTLTSLGKVDGDNFDDIVIGAPGNPTSGTCPLIPWAVRIISGSSLALIATYDGGPAGGAYVNSPISSVGDINGDLVADLAIGNPSDLQAPSDSGSVRVIMSLTGSTWFPPVNYRYYLN